MLTLAHLLPNYQITSNSSTYITHLYLIKSDFKKYFCVDVFACFNFLFKLNSSVSTKGSMLMADDWCEDSPVFVIFLNSVLSVYSLLFLSYYLAYKMYNYMYMSHLSQYSCHLQDTTTGQLPVNIWCFFSCNTCTVPGC